jgi:hypothetical protein
MVLLNKNININLTDLSKKLYYMNIPRLVIFSINNTMKVETFEVSPFSKLIYIEIGVENFIEFLEDKNHDFFEYNKDSLYIFRDTNYSDIKNILINIEGNKTILGRGSSQKSHLLSPIELRLSCYLMSILNNDFKLISSLNKFNYMTKDEYLPSGGK